MTRSRRSVLAACGAGLGALAGCASLDGGGATPSYDAARLVALGEKDVPRPPETFPVAVPDAMISGHLERVRTLLGRVPERPDLPNGVVVERLRQERESVVERLDEAEAEAEEEEDDATGLSGDPLYQLEEARHVRAAAAEVEAAYRAATDAITPAAVADRRAALRSALFAFERDWPYRGDDPTTAVVVHRSLEELRGDVRPALAPERAFPDDPGSDVFGVGELVADLEVGRAALGDAEQLRARYRDGLAEGRPYRTAISVAAGQLRLRSQQASRSLHEYVFQDADSLPFERPIEDTPLERLYRQTAESVERHRTYAADARDRGDQATALLETARTLLEARALEAVVADIRNDRVAVPETIDEIAAERRDAIDALERAWSADPQVLAVDLAHYAWVLVEEARDFLRGTEHMADHTPDANDAHYAFWYYARAARVAAAVPRTAADVQAALRAAVE